MRTFSTITDSIRNALKPIYLFLYRGSAFVAITCSLWFLVIWGFVILFFLFNNTWIAPTVVSPTSRDMLTFSAGYQQAQQNLLTLTVARDQAARDYELALQSYNSLAKLTENATSYNRTLASIAPAKQKQFEDQQTLAHQLDETKLQLEHSAKAGLVTSDTITSTLSYIEEFKANVIDSHVTWDTTNLAAKTGMVQLVTQLQQARNDIQTKQDTAKAANTSVSTAQKAYDILQDSVYYRAFNNSGVDLVFISYDALSRAKEGAPIYDCYLMIVACRQVGVIKHIYHDEQVVEFPLFNVRLSRTTRGVFAEATMTRSSSMRSTVMFVGSKPLFF